MWEVRRSGSMIIIGGCYGLYAFDLFLQMSFLFLSPRFPLPHNCGAIASQLWCNCPTIVVQLHHSCGATTTPLEKTGTLLEKTGQRLGKSFVRMLFLGHRLNPDRLTSETDHKKGSERRGNARCHLIGSLGISVRGPRLRIRHRGCAKRAGWRWICTEPPQKVGD